VPRELLEVFILTTPSKRKGKHTEDVLEIVSPEVAEELELEMELVGVVDIDGELDDWEELEFDVGLLELEMLVDGVEVDVDT
jgi:hypothetical protein